MKTHNLKHKLQDHLKKMYNMTFKDYETLLIKQNFRCAICGTHIHELSKPLFVDHDHKTGKVRGLLCPMCNFGIGMLKDNIYILKNAIRYLKKYKINHKL